jgi:thiol:disulfide interchange protein DsbA
MRRPACLIRFVLLAFGLLLATACSGHGAGKAAGGGAVTSSPFTAGNQYVVLPQPAGQPAPTGPVVLIEVFSYACPHCADFAPYMDTLRSKLPTDVQVRYMPIVFNQDWMAAGQAFYAARQLGVLARTHDALFKAKREHYPLNSLQDMAAWYARQGVDPQKFLATATNATTMRDMATDQHTEAGWGIDSTPSLVVGRLASDKQDAPFVAQMRSGDFDDFTELQKIGLWMVEHARKNR